VTLDALDAELAALPGVRVALGSTRPPASIAGCRQQPPAPRSATAAAARPRSSSLRLAT
jgi:hypothetical protein